MNKPQTLSRAISRLALLLGIPLAGLDARADGGRTVPGDSAVAAFFLFAQAGNDSRLVKAASAGSPGCGARLDVARDEGESPGDLLGA